MRLMRLARDVRHGGHPLRARSFASGRRSLASFAHAGRDDRPRVVFLERSPHVRWEAQRPAFASAAVDGVVHPHLPLWLPEDASDEPGPSSRAFLPKTARLARESAPLCSRRCTSRPSPRAASRPATTRRRSCARRRSRRGRPTHRLRRRSQQNHHHRRPRPPSSPRTTTRRRRPPSMFLLRDTPVAARRRCAPGATSTSRSAFRR